MPVASTTFKSHHHAHSCPECHKNPTPGRDTFYFWKKNDHVLHKVLVVAREIFVFGLGVGFFLANPPLFAVCFIGGAVLQPFLNKYKFFDTLKKMYYFEPALMSILLILGSILAYPASSLLASMYMGFWMGKHCADITQSKNLFPDK